MHEKDFNTVYSISCSAGIGGCPKETEVTGEVDIDGNPVSLCNHQSRLYRVFLLIQTVLSIRVNPRRRSCYFRRKL